MLLTLYRSLRISLGLATLVSVPLAAQAARPFSMDITAGVGTGWGGRYSGRAGITAEATVIPEHDAGRLFAITVGGSATSVSTDICVFESGPGSRCLTGYPSLVHVGILGGLERLGSLGTMRAMVGPAFYGGQGASGIGAQFQLDAAAGGKHVALVVAGRGSVLTRFTGERLQLGSFAVGVRLR